MGSFQNFVISFLPELAGQAFDTPDTANGFIKIGPFQENFKIPLTYWSQSEYQEHWKEAIVKLSKTDNSSCLIISIESPWQEHNLTWWLLYKQDAQVYFQKQILNFKIYKGSFDPQNPFLTIPHRASDNKASLLVQELSLPLKDLEEFAEIL